jgi:hypothetical protein
MGVSQRAVLFWSDRPNPAIYTYIYIYTYGAPVNTVPKNVAVQYSGFHVDLQLASRD